MKIRKQAKMVMLGVALIGGMGMTKLSASTGNTYEEALTKGIHENKVFNTVYIPESILEPKGDGYLAVTEFGKAREIYNSDDKADYKSIDIFEDYNYIIEDGYLTQLEKAGKQSFDFVTISERKGNYYLTYKLWGEENLTTKELKDYNIEIIPASENTRANFYKSLGSITSALYDMVD